MPTRDTSGGYLTGQLLVAMPNMQDPRFERTVIYVCMHNADGAMGLVVNRLVGSITFAELLDQLDIRTAKAPDSTPVHFGGPVETGRGFVLHSADYVQDNTIVMENGLGLTATIDILRAIANGEGPVRRLLALGYAGWGPGQLDVELQENAWLTVPADDTLVFGSALDDKWTRAIAKLGFDPNLLFAGAGHA